jgi:hypothetical protein
MTTTTVDQLYADAAEKAAANPPGRVLATVVLAVFFAIGWTWGRIWTALWFIGMSVALGAHKGITIPEKPKAAEVAVPQPGT